MMGLFGARNRQWVVILLCGQTLVASICLANNDQKKALTEAQQAKPGVPNERKVAFLGVIVEDLPAYVLTHLPDVASNGQGELLRYVIEGSPAAMAGLKEHDILLTYEDQKLFTSEQLLKLISTDRPGREISLGVLREGRKEIVKVQLGERPAIRPGVRPFPGARPHGAAGRHNLPRGERPGPADPRGPDAPRPSWHHLDAINIKWLEGDRFHATLSHFVENGKIEKHEYQGTREELRKLIDADDDLKSNERHHLLRCLDIPEQPNPWKLFDDPQESGF